MPIEVDLNTSYKSYDLDTEDINGSNITKELLLERLPFILSTSGLSKDIVQLIWSASESAKEEKEIVNLYSRLRLNHNDEHVKGYQPSCFSPIHTNKYHAICQKESSQITDERGACYGSQDPIAYTKSTTGCVSSGMETSKLSTFSPVLSSTIMHGYDKSYRLPPTHGSHLSPPRHSPILKDGRDYLREVKDEKSFDFKTPPKPTAIERVSKALILIVPHSCTLIIISNALRFKFNNHLLYY